ncbi:hypothetical protein TA3x_000433 [Tundrisphaera sp. TA3]|uniref:hypothetical protein n=1 Tax=Tundrisphaera sp. TA3 TaxID=3435775 RepID=UPI003EBFF7EE
MSRKIKTYPKIRPYDKKPFSFHMSDRNTMLCVLFVAGGLLALEIGAEEQKSDSGYSGVPKAVKAAHAKPKRLSPEDEAEKAINDADWGEVFAKCHATPGCEQQVAAIKPRRKK